MRGGAFFGTGGSALDKSSEGDVVDSSCVLTLVLDLNSTLSAPPVDQARRGNVGGLVVGGGGRTSAVDAPDVLESLRIAGALLSTIVPDPSKVLLTPRSDQARLIAP